MTSNPYVVNVSSIQDYMRCRWRWVARWVLNRVPHEARPLRFGKLLHQIFEDHHAGYPMEQAIIIWQKKWETEALTADTELDRAIARDALEDLALMREPLLHWKDEYPLDNPPLSVEQPFRVPSPYDPTIEFIGRPDRVTTLWGKLVHVQNRSLSAGVNFGLYSELTTRSMHEHLYAYAGQVQYPDIPYGGTVLNLVRKLKYRGVPTKKNPEGKVLHEIKELLWQGYVNINPKINEQMMREITTYAQEMRETERRFVEEGIWPVPNETLNGGLYGNSIDPYFYVLNGDTTLENNNLFKDRVSTYA